MMFDLTAETKIKPFAPDILFFGTKASNMAPDETRQNALSHLGLYSYAYRNFMEQ